MMKSYALLDDKIMTMSQVSKALGLSRTTLHARINEGEFPKPFKLGKRMNAWFKADIETWLNDQREKSRQ